MDKILLIKLKKTDVNEFCKCCKTFESDIDLIDGSHVFDAKDYRHVIFMSFDKNLCVSINSNEKEEILRFYKKMSRYKSK